MLLRLGRRRELRDARRLGDERGGGERARAPLGRRLLNKLAQLLVEREDGRVRRRRDRERPVDDAPDERPDAPLLALVAVGVVGHLGVEVGRLERVRAPADERLHALERDELVEDAPAAVELDAREPEARPVAVQALRDEHAARHAKDGPERLGALVKVVAVEQEVGAELERLDAGEGRVGEEARRSERVVREDEVAVRVGVRRRRCRRVEHAAEREDDEDGGELGAVRVVRRVGGDEVVLVEDLLLERRELERQVLPLRGRRRRSVSDSPRRPGKEVQVAGEGEDGMEGQEGGGRG